MFLSKMSGAKWENIWKGNSVENVLEGLVFSFWKQAPR